MRRTEVEVSNIRKAWTGEVGKMVKSEDPKLVCPMDTTKSHSY